MCLHASAAARHKASVPRSCVMEHRRVLDAFLGRNKMRLVLALLLQVAMVSSAFAADDNTYSPNVVIVGSLLIILIVIYVLPLAIAYARGHESRAKIVALNLLLGWTVLGWIGALVWACTPAQIGSKSHR